MGGILSRLVPDCLSKSNSQDQHFLQIEDEQLLRQQAYQREALQQKFHQEALQQACHQVLQQACQQEALQQEALQQEALQQEALQQACHQEVLQQEALQQEALQQACHQEVLQQEALQQEALQQACHQEVLQQEALQQEALQQPCHQEALQQECQQEACHQEALQTKIHLMHIQQLPYDVSPQYLQLSTISVPKNNIFLHTKYNWSRKKHLAPLHRVLLPKAKILSSHSTSLSEVYCQTIDEYDDTYEEVMQHFMKSSQKHYLKVESIEEVFNLFTRCFYLLKKEEYKVLYKNVHERLLFHGTKSETVDIILQENFNWRLHGTTKGNIFGKGVSFSPFPTYSSDYCRPRKGSRVMIAAKVLQANACNGNEEMIIPPELPGQKGLRYDTSKRPNGKVVVKYCDDEFYPFYLVTFSGNSFKKYDY